MAAARRIGTDWAEVAVAMDRGLRVFADFSRPVLASAGAHDLSPGNLLFLVSIGDGDAYVSDLVRRGRYLGSNASYALKSLQSGGWIDRRQDPEDRRNAIVSMTEAGRSLVWALRSACASSGPESTAAVDALRSLEAHCARLPLQSTPKA